MSLYPSRILQAEQTGRVPCNANLEPDQEIAVRLNRRMYRLSFALCATSVLGHAQQAVRPTHVLGAPVAMTDQAGTRAPSEGIVISVGDTLSVNVFDTPELTRDVRVSSDGTVNLPLLGDVPVASLSEAEAARHINAAYLDGHFLLHPQTSVIIREFASRGVVITGEVVKPGVYPVAGPRSVLDIIAQAGGLTANADTRILIKRADGSLAPIVNMPLDNGEKTLRSDISVSAGDRVVAERAGTIYVLGQVTRPGGYLMQHNGSVTVLEAIAAANGSTRIAAENGVLLIHRDGDSYTTQRVMLHDIYKGKKPDFALVSGDVLYVPGSFTRDLIANAPAILGTIGGAAIYSIGTR